MLDGNYDRTNFIKWKTVSTVIWLDYSFTRTLWQVFKRSIGRAAKRQELWPGTNNRESFIMTFFSKRSIIWWMITSYKRMGAGYRAYLADPQLKHIYFIRLKSPRETNEFLQNL